MCDYREEDAAREDVISWLVWAGVVAFFVVWSIVYFIAIAQGDVIAPWL